MNNDCAPTAVSKSAVDTNSAGLPKRKSSATTRNRQAAKVNQLAYNRTIHRINRCHGVQLKSY